MGFARDLQSAESTVTFGTPGTAQTPVKWALPLVREKSAAGAAAGLQIPAGSYCGESSSATELRLVHEMHIRESFGSSSDRRVIASSCANCGHDFAKGGGGKFEPVRQTRYPELRICASFSYSWPCRLRLIPRNFAERVSFYGLSRVQLKCHDKAYVFVL